MKIVIIKGGSVAQKRLNIRGKISALFLMGFVFSGWLLINGSDDIPEKSCFYSSLHHTGEGMRYWYEENGGFMGITGIPYSKLDCKTCHVQSCETCHAVKQGEKCSYSLKKARESDTCLTCHSREKVTFKLCEKNNTLDVHVANGMACADCHKGGDVHGDGVHYKTMRDSEGVKVSCSECHEAEKSVKAHQVHDDKLDCAACHIANTTSCLNCHFDKFLEQKTRKGNFFPPCQDWTLLVNYRGKVTSGNVQTLVYQKQKFIAYAPYFTHAVQAKARDCGDCHDNAAVRRITAGQPVPMATFSENRMISWKGVVPLIPDKLKWDFADKQGDQWILLKTDKKPVVQFACYAEPLTADQLKKLQASQKE
jgi:hypothetical protein